MEIPGWLPVCGSSLAVCVGVWQSAVWVTVSLQFELGCLQTLSPRLTVCGSRLAVCTLMNLTSRQLQTTADKLQTIRRQQNPDRTETADSEMVNAHNLWWRPTLRYENSDNCPEGAYCVEV